MQRTIYGLKKSFSHRTDAIVDGRFSTMFFHERQKIPARAKNFIRIGTICTVCLHERLNATTTLMGYCCQSVVTNKKRERQLENKGALFYRQSTLSNSAKGYRIPYETGNEHRFIFCRCFCLFHFSLAAFSFSGECVEPLH